MGIASIIGIILGALAGFFGDTRLRMPRIKYWLTLFGLFMGIFYGFVAGLGAWPHFAILNFVGAMLGRFYLQRRFGVERWYAYAPIVLAGYSCGVGLIGMTSIAIALISKAVSQVVF